MFSEPSLIAPCCWPVEMGDYRYVIAVKRDNQNRKQYSISYSNSDLKINYEYCAQVMIDKKKQLILLNFNTILDYFKFENVACNGSGAHEFNVKSVSPADIYFRHILYAFPVGVLSFSL